MSCRVAETILACAESMEYFIEALNSARVFRFIDGLLERSGNLDVDNVMLMRIRNLEKEN